MRPFLVRHHRLGDAKKYGCKDQQGEYFYSDDPPSMYEDDANIACFYEGYLRLSTEQKTEVYKMQMKVDEAVIEKFDAKKREAKITEYLRLLGLMYAKLLRLDGGSDTIYPTQ